MSDEKLKEIVSQLLKNYYDRRMQKIEKLDLNTTLKSKNPYLFKANGKERVSEIIVEILSAYMSSSDEGIFGDAFFEILAEKVSNGEVSEAEGVDITIKKDDIYKAIAVKSGTNVFNAASKKQQKTNFNSLRARVAGKRGLNFIPIIGYGYGKRDVCKDGIIEVAGQAFWEELTGDSEFYIRIINLMEIPTDQQEEYQKKFDAAVNRFSNEFTKKFCKEDYTIDWAKLLEFNSGKPFKKLLVEPKNKSLSINEKVKFIVKKMYSEEVIEDITCSDRLEYEIIEKTQDDVFVLDSTKGLFYFTDKAQKGDIVKIIIQYFDKKGTRTFKCK